MFWITIILVLPLLKSKPYQGWVTSPKDLGEISKNLSGIKGPFSYTDGLQTKLEYVQDTQYQMIRLVITVFRKNDTIHAYQDYLMGKAELYNFTLDKSSGNVWDKRYQIYQFSNLRQIPYARLIIQYGTNSTIILIRFMQSSQLQQICHQKDIKRKNKQNTLKVLSQKKQAIRLNRTTSINKSQTIQKDLLKPSINQKKINQYFNEEEERAVFLIFSCLLFIGINKILLQLNSDNMLESTILTNELTIFSSIVFILQYYPKLQQSYMIIQTLMPVLLSIKAIIIISRIKARFAFLIEQKKKFQSILALFVHMLSLILPYSAHIKLILLLLIYESWNQYQADSIQQQARQAYFIQTTFALAEIVTMLWLFQVPHNWPIDETITYVGCFLIWAFHTSLCELSYHGGIKFHLRKAKWHLNNYLKLFGINWGVQVCMICFGQLRRFGCVEETLVQGICGHIFHESCIESKKMNYCPFDKIPLVE